MGAGRIFQAVSKLRVWGTGVPQRGPVGCRTPVGVWGQNPQKLTTSFENNAQILRVLKRSTTFSVTNAQKHFITFPGGGKCPLHMSVG